MSDSFGRSAQPSVPPTELGRLRILSSTSGLRVSPLALGGGNIGQAWNKVWGVMTKERAFELLDTYLDVSRLLSLFLIQMHKSTAGTQLTFLQAGGNFIDTSNSYQNGESEAWIGEWMSQREGRIRDQVVLATKYTADSQIVAAGEGKKGRTVNAGGNHRRSLHMSVRDLL